MSVFTFTVDVDGVDDTSEDHVEALIAHEEVVMISSTGGVVAIALTIEAASAGAAIRAGVRIVELAVEGARVRRVDLDLVAATDIAARVGVSRQAVGLWVASGRDGRPFPTPLGHVAGGTRVWVWSAVVPWLQEHGHATDECPLDHGAIVEANALLLRPRRRGRLAASVAA